MEAFALPEGDPVYEVAVRGSGWQNEVQEIKAVAALTSSETEIQVNVSFNAWRRFERWFLGLSNASSGWYGGGWRQAYRTRRGKHRIFCKHNHRREHSRAVVRRIPLVVID